jgi:hypothetical protein
MVSISDVVNYCKTHQAVKFQSIDGNIIYSLWNSEKVEKLNSEYQVDRFLPGFIAFGTDGGDEMLAVKTDNGGIYSVPFIPMEEKEAVKIADDFEGFLKLVK